ncbi:MAG TPA: NAD(P)H-binding protein [Polyangiaceae bacterium]|nr:NAD(P)H-binding protein [Polyangiaceae bacterium]
MNIVLFGASGMIGQRIAAEALRRGHALTAAARDPSRLEGLGAGARGVRADVLDAAAVGAAAEGADAIVSAVGPARGAPAAMLSDAARALVEGAKRARVRRLAVVGGAGSLEVAPGVRVVDTPQFPAALRGIALAHADSLEALRAAAAGADLDWFYLSPPALIEPGERRGDYRVGGDRLLVDEKGQSRISAEDYAVALLDELERPKHSRRRFTVAY